MQGQPEAPTEDVAERRRRNGVYHMAMGYRRLSAAGNDQLAQIIHQFVGSHLQAEYHNEVRHAAPLPSLAADGVLDNAIYHYAMGWRRISAASQERQALDRLAQDLETHLSYRLGSRFDAESVRAIQYEDSDPPERREEESGFDPLGGE